MDANSFTDLVRIPLLTVCMINLVIIVPVLGLLELLL